MTLVLWAALPVRNDTLDGQHRETVQKCFSNVRPWLVKCFLTAGMYCIEFKCKSWSSVIISMKLGSGRLIGHCCPRTRSKKYKVNANTESKTIMNIAYGFSLFQYMCVLCAVILQKQQTSPGCLYSLLYTYKIYYAALVSSSDRQLN